MLISQFALAWWTKPLWTERKDPFGIFNSLTGILGGGLKMRRGLFFGFQRKPNSSGS
jgi:hypothetical protein